MSLIDYSDLEQEINDAQEPIALPKGTEVKVRIIQVRIGTSEKSGADYFIPILEALGDGMERVKEISDFLWALDKENLTSKEYDRALYQFKKFAKCFGIDLSRPFDPEENLVGLEGWIIVGLKKSDEYGEQNNVSKYILPR
jgi:hypothetical protein